MMDSNDPGKTRRSLSLQSPPVQAALVSGTFVLLVAVLQVSSGLMASRAARIQREHERREKLYTDRVNAISDLNLLKWRVQKDAMERAYKHDRNLQSCMDNGLDEKACFDDAILDSKAQIELDGLNERALSELVLLFPDINPQDLRMRKSKWIVAYKQFLGDVHHAALDGNLRAKRAELLKSLETALYADMTDLEYSSIKYARKQLNASTIPED